MRLLLVLLLFPVALSAQSSRVDRCGYEHVHRSLQKLGIKISSDHDMGQPAMKTTGANDTIPVVFHVILNRTQIDKLGGDEGIRSFIDEQLVYLNRDFNAQNADSINIPSSFRSVFGNAGIRFGLAHTKYDGSATQGYEIVVTNKKGINIDGGSGSAVAFSDAKFSSAGGADAWDVHRYLNIWVVNMYEDNATSQYVGITISPRAASGNFLEPEMGIVLNYRTWVPGFAGRILTHEMGHYFSLVHIWGNNELCPNEGGEDDGIADTPPQADATYNICPLFPMYDGCSPSGSGIMFMNYMDYTDEKCQNMFTKGQAEVMREDISVSGLSYSLLQHPELLRWPVLTQDNEFKLYPNPVKDMLNIFFPAGATGLKEIRIIDMIGKTVNQISINTQDHLYEVDVRGLRRDVYFIQLQFQDKITLKKIVIN